MTRGAALLLALACALPARAADDASAVFQGVSPSVYSIITQSASAGMMGSGVVVRPGYIVTNFHVVKGATHIKVQHNGSEEEAALAASDAEHDLALLHVYALAAPAVRFGDSQGLRVGQAVYAIGSPRGLELSLSAGLVSSLRVAKDGNVIQTTAPISPGSSGGGLFDQYGRLVGITVGQISNAQNLNFALPVEWLHYVGVAVKASDVSELQNGAAVTTAMATAEPPVPQNLAQPLNETPPSAPATSPPPHAQTPAAAPAKAPAPAAGKPPATNLYVVTGTIVLLLVLAIPAARRLADFMSSDTLPDPPRNARAAPTRAQRLEPFRQQARDELKSERRDDDTWLRALEQAHGDQPRALVAYIDLRSEALYKAEMDRRWNSARSNQPGPRA
ncbi:MAG TPA: trypsin-like peptidase domain-containing protein [Nevskiaceae bacterium]|nr:trypsin-like peptidase domain-containing protein [Nevskiaceae bacterium]